MTIALTRRLPICVVEDCGDSVTGQFKHNMFKWLLPVTGNGQKR